jgi:hypothetical protein
MLGADRKLLSITSRVPARVEMQVPMATKTVDFGK